VILELGSINRRIEQQAHAQPRSVASLYAPAQLRSLEITKGDNTHRWLGPTHVWAYRLTSRPSAPALEFDSEFLVPDSLRLMAYLKRFSAEHGWQPLGRLIFQRSKEDAASEYATGSIFVQLLMRRETFGYAWTLRSGRQQRLRLELASPNLELMYDGATQRWNLNAGESIPINEASLHMFKPNDDS
jgi:hypothetical protein